MGFPPRKIKNGLPVPAAKKDIVPLYHKFGVLEVGSSTVSQNYENR
jgi:hypothetical protein